MLVIIVYLLVFGIMIGSLYPIDAGLSFGDLASVLLMLIVGGEMVSGKSRNNLIVKYTFGYLGLMMLACVLNNSYTDTQFLNYFRIMIEGLIAFLAVWINIKNEKNFKLFTLFLLIYFFYFIVSSRNMLNTSMVSEEHFQLMSFGIGRNNWGFASLLTIIILSYILYKIRPRFYKYLILLYPVLIFFIYFSTSRFALLSLLIFALFFRHWIGSKISISEIVLYTLVVISYPFLSSILFETVDSGILSESQALFDDKINSTADDGFYVRLLELNLIPMWNYITEEANPLQVILGDGHSICHGVFAHTFLSTGIVGFIYFLRYHWIIIKRYYKNSKTGQYIAFVIFIMIFNDFVTNARFIILSNNVYYMIIIAYLCRYETLYENIKKVRKL